MFRNSRTANAPDASGGALLAQVIDALGLDATASVEDVLAVIRVLVEKSKAVPAEPSVGEVMRGLSAREIEKCRARGVDFASYKAMRDGMRARKEAQ